MNLRLRTLYALFAVSGFCGLIYESIWSHYLKLFLGHAAYAQTVVLIVFIGGLALGSWLAGAFAARLRRPLLAYAAAELLVGLAALGFHRFFVGATGWAYASLLPAACPADGWCVAQWLFAAAMILPQSVLLGTTFPLMTGGVLRLQQEGAGAKLSLLYFLNSIGAVVGVLASGYVLIPAIGLPGALASAGITNVALAFAVYFVEKATVPQPAVRLAPAAGGSAPREMPSAPLLLAVALLTGLSSFVYEVAWIRSLSLVLGATTHAFELMLAAFILGLALGGLYIRARIDRIPRVLRYLALVQVTMGLLALLTLPTYDFSFDLMAWLVGALRSSESGWALFNVASSLLCLAVMLPATFMAGMTLPLITLALLRSPLGERSIGHVYAANTFGGILGVLLAVHFALPVLGLKGALVLGSAVDIALGVWLLARDRSAPRPLRLGFGGVGLAAVLVAALFFHLDPRKLASAVFTYGHAQLAPGYEISSHKDGRTATVDVIYNPVLGSLSIATNGKVDGAMMRGERPGPDEQTMLLLAALGLAYRPDARDAAVIGFGTGMSTTTLLGSPRLRRVDTIEIEPAMPRGAEAFRYFTEPAYSDPRSHIVIDDAKSYFARTRRRYDLILSEPSNPWVSGVASLFTREFYARVRGQLRPGGVLVQWMHTYSFNDPLFASILRALRESFPAFTVYAPNDGDIVVVATAGAALAPLSGEVFGLGRIPRYLERIDVRRVEDLAVRRIGDQDTMRALFDVVQVAPNSDYFPIVATYAGKARFLREKAAGVEQLALAPWPILEMASRGALPPAYPLSPARWPASRQAAGGPAGGGRPGLPRRARRARGGARAAGQLLPRLPRLPCPLHRLPGHAARRGVVGRGGGGRLPPHRVPSAGGFGGGVGAGALGPLLWGVAGASAQLVRRVFRPRTPRCGRRRRRRARRGRGRAGRRPAGVLLRRGDDRSHRRRPHGRGTAHLRALPSRADRGAAGTGRLPLDRGLGARRGRRDAAGVARAGRPGARRLAMAATRTRAAGIHLAASMAGVGAALAAAFALWYPQPYFEAMGGWGLAALMLGVNVAIGPLATWIVFAPGKARHLLLLDLGVIVALQLAAFAYGMHVVAEARPAYMLFVRDRFEIAAADELDPAALAQAARGFRTVSWRGPRLAAAVLPRDPQERMQVMLAGLAGADLKAFPRYYVPYAGQAADAGAKARPLAALRARHPQDAARIARAVAATGVPESRLGYLPLRGRKKDLSVLVERAGGRVAGFVSVDPW